MATYYSPSGNPPAQTRGTSPSMRSEFVLIQTGFTNVNTDLQAEVTNRTNADALKAPLASPALTGVPTAPTAAAGTNSTQIATTAFAAGLSFAAALPVQGGNAGKMVTTDGATASWTNLLNSGVMRWKDSTDATKLLALDLSGVTTATTRTITVPNKNGTFAMTSDVGVIAVAGPFTPTAAANFDALSVFSASYDNYRIFIDGVLPAANDSLLLRLASGGVVDAGANYAAATSFAASFDGFAGTASATLAAGKGISVVIDILNANDATNAKILNAIGSTHKDAVPTYSRVVSLSMYTAANAVSGFRLYWSGGANFSAVGKIRIYGYN